MLYQKIKILVQKFWRKTAGVLLIFLGIIGLFLPFLQGVAMILAGLVLLGNKRAIVWFDKLKCMTNKWVKKK